MNQALPQIDPHPNTVSSRSTRAGQFSAFLNTEKKAERDIVIKLLFGIQGVLGLILGISRNKSGHCINKEQTKFIIA